MLGAGLAVASPAGDLRKGGRKKTAVRPRFFCWARARRVLQHANVRGLQALLALLDFEFDALVFQQSLEAIALDVTEVSEQVSAARVLSDEAEALALVEPLHGTGLGRHGRKSYLSSNDAQHMRRMQRHSRNDQGDFYRSLLRRPGNRGSQQVGRRIFSNHCLAYNCAADCTRTNRNARRIRE